MPYAGGGRLPAESASKLGHLAVVNSEWVRTLIHAFDSPDTAKEDPSQTKWIAVEPDTAQALRSVWATDGSFVTIASTERPAKEVSFVKTALLTVDRARLDSIDKTNPHPLLLQDVLTGSAVFHATVFPLKNVRSSLGTNYDAVRHIVRDSVKIDETGAFYETLKWLAYQMWDDSPVASPSFACPHCGVDHPGLPPGTDDGPCPSCKKPVFLTDMIGFHLDMDEDSAPDSVASSYMLVMEHLMLFTAIRLLWHHSDRQLFSDSLFIKDGPLSLRGQYSKLVPRIRSFIEHTKSTGRPIHVVGQEKTGAFVDHLASIVRFAPPHNRDERAAAAVLSHDYVRKQVYRSPDLSNPYGMRTNWGEKVFYKCDPATYMVLNVPTGDYNPAGGFPQPEDLVGLHRILNTLPSLISHRFQGALFPIELANGIASMSSYPSAAILRRFSEDRAL